MGEEVISCDVVVVGGGSAGAVAARRLLDAGMRVLLLEAGGPDTNPAIHVPARVHELWFSEEDWAYQTAPQEHAANRRLHWPRGRVLGGSSSLNGMIHVRGAPADYDSWAYWECRLVVGRRFCPCSARSRTSIEEPPSSTASAGRCTSTPAGSPPP